ncbi:TIGR02466 family protein [Nitrospira sp. BLG_2]|uniref:TIGR02466 family protein n=1 Tax=Nitrospira sp. BLG_2 TaxID=3397507 RepID=UPI003B99CC51
MASEPVAHTTSKIEVSIAPLFATPVLTFIAEEHERLNAELSRVILEREASQPAHSDPEVIGWSSPHDLSMLEWAAPAINELLGHVIHIASQMTELLDASVRHEQSLEWRVAEIWANVQRNGGSNAAHPHPGSFWSGVYYVDSGEMSDGLSGGELRLFDPRGCLPRMLAPYLRYKIPALHDAGTSISLTPSAGQCLLFPGWLFHAVNVYSGNVPRISIAFNLDPMLKGS